ncbi:RNA methyltransferase [Micrococcus sp. HG099]|uniref:TrmH family RNA methyltransferase n=1 Tax=Micrococcus sp. HG099 TaxID=2969755 RepID=UPI00215B6712|nr:RNA methyltransferase [Micrococcus sp. HG099]MCR8675909.1 RNA methyltransferase [Micrococcus sp. HG099]
MAEPAATAGPDGREVRLARAEDLADPRLAPYTTLTDAALRRRVDAEHGVFLAESSQVVRRALAAGHTPRSFLLGDRYRESFADVLAVHPDVPLFTGPDEVLTSLTGFHLHRGALAAMDRPAPRLVTDVLAGARRVLIAEDLVDHTNLGAVVRSAVALGWDALLLTPQAADPLYRRAIRVSMGTVFRLPWARLEGPVAEAVPALREAGFAVAALEVTGRAVGLDGPELEPLRSADRLALVLGQEGPGVRPETLAHTDADVVIPMPDGVDSLNVAAAAAVALWELRSR